MNRDLCFLLVALVLSAPAAGQRANWELTEGVRVHPNFRGPTPKHSDVIFSTRFKRPEALEAMQAFGATRVEWVYSTDKAFVAALTAKAPWFGGTINSNASGMPQVARPSDDAMAKDFDGISLVHHLMRAWGGKGSTPSTHPGRIVTTTHPETRKVLKAQARFYIDLGAASLQFDDPMLQAYSGIYLGGDFNASTLAGFNRWLATYPDREELRRLGLDSIQGDYRGFLKTRYGITDAQEYMRRYKSLPTTGLWLRYLKQSVGEFFRELRGFLRQVRLDRPVPLSMNLGILDWPDENKWHFFLAPFADYAMAETPILNTPELVARAATARALGMGYAPSIKPRGRAENRTAIATLYALGGVPLVPWDVFDGNDEKGQAKRFFGKPEDYADLYRFVRKNPALFDGKELPAVVGIPVPVHNFNTRATADLVHRLIEKNIPFAFVLTGGKEATYSVDTSRARHFKLLVTANAEGDFLPADIKDLKALPVRLINAAQFDDQALRELSPFVVAGDTLALKLYARADAHQLVIHLVDEGKANQQVHDPACRRRIGIRKALTGQARFPNVTWYSGETVTRLTTTDGQLETFVTVPECSFWGVLSLEYKG